MKTKSMYECIFDGAEKEERYRKANAFTVPGKAVVCRKLAEYLDVYKCTNNIALLGADLGWNVMLLSGNLPQSDIVAFDKSSIAIKYAREVCDNARCHFVHADVRNTKVDYGLYDAVVAIFFLHLLDDFLHFLKSVSDQLKDGATLSMVYVTDEQWSRNPLGKYMPISSLRNPFVLGDVSNELSAMGMALVGNESISRIDKIHTRDIPVVFDKCANSSLFNLSELNINVLHEDLSKTSINNHITLQFDCQLVVFRKERSHGNKTD